MWKKETKDGKLCMYSGLSVTFGLKRFKPSGLSESKLSCVTAEKT